jgi:PAS domain-containing protein
MRLPRPIGYQCAYLTTVYSRIPVKLMAGLMGTDKLQADESEAYFRVLIESAPDAMIIVDDDGEIAIVNGQTEKMFGYDREELIGNKIEMLLPDRIRNSHVGHREKCAVGLVSPLGFLARFYDLLLHAFATCNVAYNAGDK